jgi:hypothetical protein
MMSIPLARSCAVREIGKNEVNAARFNVFQNVQAVAVKQFTVRIHIPPHYVRHPVSLKHVSLCCATAPTAVRLICSHHTSLSRSKHGM